MGGVVIARGTDKLLNMSRSGLISDEEFSVKSVQVRDRFAQLTLLLEATDRGRDEHADLARTAFELSRNRSERWLTAPTTRRSVRFWKSSL